MSTVVREEDAVPNGTFLAEEMPHREHLEGQR